MNETEQLTITQTPTGYWSVRRGSTHITGAMTRAGAEAERDLLSRLGSRRERRNARADDSGKTRGSGKTPGGGKTPERGRARYQQRAR